MLFKDKIAEKQKVISNEFDNLINIGFKNQHHVGDLLLLNINGFFDKDTLIWNQNPENQKLNPHVIGPGHEGHSENTHYKFINKYRTLNIHPLLHEEYLKDLQWSPENQKHIEEMTEIEETSIQLEMLIYLKFWEADLVIKKLYQFVRILHGEHYDWQFKIAESNRDKNATGARQDIIRKLIRDRLKEMSPVMYKLIKDTYLAQVRNSIAHSNYSFLGRNIHLNNTIESDIHSQLVVIPFDEWIDIFHNTLMLHNEMIRLKNKVLTHYSDQALKNNNTYKIMITESDGKQYLKTLIYRKQYDDWSYKQS